MCEVDSLHLCLWLVVVAMRGAAKFVNSFLVHSPSMDHDYHKWYLGFKSMGGTATCFHGFRQGIWNSCIFQRRRKKKFGNGLAGAWIIKICRQQPPSKHIPWKISNTYAELVSWHFHNFSFKFEKERKLQFTPFYWADLTVSSTLEN